MVSLQCNYCASEAPYATYLTKATQLEQHNHPQVTACRQAAPAANQVEPTCCTRAVLPFPVLSARHAEFTVHSCTEENHTHTNRPCIRLQDEDPRKQKIFSSEREHQLQMKDNTEISIIFVTAAKLHRITFLYGVIADFSQLCKKTPFDDTVKRQNNET